MALITAGMKKQAIGLLVLAGIGYVALKNSGKITGRATDAINTARDNINKAKNDIETYRSEHTQRESSRGGRT